MLIEKKDVPIVAMDFMNDVHYEDIDIINTLFDLVLMYEKDENQTNFEAINNQFTKWYAHTVEHFKGEEIKMREMHFPPYPMHKSEHDNALYRMDEVFKNWQESKDIQALKIYLKEEVPSWLTQHIQSMDTVTAMFFSSGSSPCSIH